MRIFLRLIRFLWPYKWRVALAILLGVAMVASNVGLLAVAAYVISAAAIVSYLSMLAIPVYLVRLFSVSRAGSRYAERLLSHDVTFKLLARLRAWFYASLEPLAPARLLRYRSGDLLSRIVKDVEELENIYLRSFSPVAVALAVSLLAGLIFYIFSPQMALVALSFLLVTGVGVPLLVRALSRGLGRRQLELRAESSARILDGVQGVRDIVAFGREDDESGELAALQRKLDRTQERMALITGLQNSLTDLMMNLALVAVLVLAIPLVAAGGMNGVYLAFLALVMLGSFEAVAPLGTGFPVPRPLPRRGGAALRGGGRRTGGRRPTRTPPAADGRQARFRRGELQLRRGRPARSRRHNVFSEDRRQARGGRAERFG